MRLLVKQSILMKNYMVIIHSELIELIQNHLLLKKHTFKEGVMILSILITGF